MKPRYALRDLDDAEPGMILSGPVLGSHGETLIPGGAELTDSMLAMLRGRGLAQISVVEMLSEAELAAERERSQNRVAQLFRNCAGQHASDALMRGVLKYRLGERP